MSQSNAHTERDPVAGIGLLFYSFAVAGTGLQHLLARDFVTRMFPDLPAGLPARAAIACTFGLLLAVLGGALAARWKARPAALVLAALFALSLAFLHLPKIAANPGFGGAWTNPAKVVVFLGTALLLAARADPAEKPERRRQAERLALVLFSAFLILAGVQHLVYRAFVATLVPAWIPARQFWGDFAGAALLAGGIGLLAPKTRRLAALLTAAMIFSWFLILHIPRALAASDPPPEWAGVCESLAMSGVALLLAGKVRRAADGPPSSI